VHNWARFICSVNHDVFLMNVHKSSCKKVAFRTCTPKVQSLLYINLDLSVRVPHVKSLKTVDLIDMCVIHLAVTKTMKTEKNRPVVIHN
jgi:hypothetical protein